MQQSAFSLSYVAVLLLLVPNWKILNYHKFDSFSMQIKKTTVNLNVNHTSLTLSTLIGYLLSAKHVTSFSSEW